MWAAPSGYSAADRLRSGTREDARAGLSHVRERTLDLARAWREALGPALQVPCDAGLNPPLWEWGHVAWFQDWWIVRNRQLALGVRCDPDHARAPSHLAEADAWYDSSRVPHDSRWHLPLPDWDATLEWLEGTLARVLQRLEEADEDDASLYFFRLACLHEAMHAEASCYMARVLGIAVPLAAPVLGAPASARVPAQRFRLGATSVGFAFDNELPAHEVDLGAYEIDLQPVRWSQFAEFIAGGGYEHPRWWTAEGWRWRQAARRQPPHPGPGSCAAVHLSAHEADAWCRWAGRRLPTEAEWECAALAVPGFAWGQVWEWTADAFGPYRGFEPHPYRDYSLPWFGSRRVLRGASPATPDLLAHPRYRNFFEPHRCDILAGFRSCAGSAAEARV